MAQPVTGIILYRPSTAATAWEPHPPLPDVAPSNFFGFRMPFLTRSARQLGAVLAVLLLVLPSDLAAQVRRPDSVPGATPQTRRAARHRTEFLVGMGTSRLSERNGTGSSMPIGAIGLRRQFGPEWLYLGGTVDAGRTKIDGEIFPYERRAEGDSSRFFAVGGSATIASARATADLMWNLGEDMKFRAGVGLNAGLYTVLPSPARGEGAGAFVGPTYGLSLVGEYDLTRRFAVMGNFGFTQVNGFKRDKLRPSASSGEDPVFGTPFQPAPPEAKGFSGLRMFFGLSYRLGVPPRRSAR
jgi:hypothetical protein